MIILLVTFWNSVLLNQLLVLHLSACIFVIIFNSLGSWLFVIIGLSIILECGILKSINRLFLLHNNCVLFLFFISCLFLIFNFVLLSFGLSFLITWLVWIQHLLSLRSTFIIILRSLCRNLVFVCMFVTLCQLTIQQGNISIIVIEEFF